MDNPPICVEYGYIRAENALNAIATYVTAVTHHPPECCCLINGFLQKGTPATSSHHSRCTLLETHEWQAFYCTIHQTSNPPERLSDLRTCVRWITSA